MWIILIVSYAIFAANGSFVNLLEGGVQLNLNNFKDFLAVFTGKPIYIELHIPYLPQPYDFVAVYEPLSFTIGVFSIFWIIFGITIGRLSKTYEEVIFGAIFQFSSVLMFSNCLNYSPDIVYASAGFLLLFISSLGCFQHKMLQKNQSDQ